VLQMAQERDPHLGGIRKVLKANAGSADNPLPRFFMQNGILCKKYMLKNSQREKQCNQSAQHAAGSNNPPFANKQ